MVPIGAYATETVLRKRDVLDYIDWVWWLQEIEAHRQDPTVQWNKDMSWDEMFEAVGLNRRECEGYGARMGDRIGTDLGTAQLYWPCVEPIVYDR